MALSHSPKIITDGLIMYIDAGNVRSYPRTGTSWNNLGTSSITGILTNNPSFSSSNIGTIAFDGVDDYINLGKNSINWANITETTIIGWIRTNTTPLHVTGLIAQGDFNSGGQDFSLGYDGGGANPATRVSFHWKNIWNTEDARIEVNQLTLTNWNMFAGRANLNRINLWVNDGRLQNTRTGLNNTKVIDQVNYDMVIGKASYTGRYISGNIGAVLIYNRYLTDIELLNNFNAMRGRFGI